MVSIKIHYDGISVDGEFISLRELRRMNTKFSIRMINEVLIKRNTKIVAQSRPWVLTNKFMPIKPRLKYSSPKARFFRFK
jgi:hypothetical protein